MSNSISKSWFVWWYLKSAYFCAHDYMKVAWQLQLQRQRWFHLVQQSIVLSSSVNRTLITHLIKECSLYTLKETAYNASGIRSHLWAYPINTIRKFGDGESNLYCLLPSRNQYVNSVKHAKLNLFAWLLATQPVQQHKMSSRNMSRELLIRRKSCGARLLFLVFMGLIPANKHDLAGCRKKKHFQ